ncbi:MAG: YcxB family protein [Planctomycetota bacterium]
MDQNPFASPAAATADSRALGPLEPPQTVRFNLGEEDVIAFSEHAYQQSDSVRKALRSGRNRLLTITLFNFCMAAFISQLQTVTFLVVMLLAACACTGTMALLMPRMQRRNIRKFNKKLIAESQSPGFFGPKEVTITETEIIQSDKAGQQLRRWWAIDRVSATGEACYLFLTPMSGFIIPARAFVDESAYGAFVDLVERLSESSRGDPER